MGLDAWCRAKGWTDRELAEACGVCREAARLWRLNRRMPDAGHRQTILRVTDGSVRAIDLLWTAGQARESVDVDAI